MRKFLFLSVLATLLLGWGCTEDEGGAIALLAKEVLYTSRERLKFSEVQIAGQSIDVSDQRFWKAEGSYPVVCYKLDPNGI